MTARASAPTDGEELKFVETQVASPAKGLSSLEILKPATSDYETERKLQSSAALKVERRCRRLIQLVANQEWENPDFTRLLAPDFRAFLPHSDTPCTSTRQAYLDDYCDFFRAYPGYKCEIIDLSTYANEESGTATVWMHFIVYGHPSTLVRENITIGYWVLRKRGWIAVKQTGLRGFGGNL